MTKCLVIQGLILLFLFPNLIYPQQKIKINIVGNKFIKTDEFKNRLIKLDLLTISNASKVLSNLAIKRGLYNSKITNLKIDSSKYPDEIFYEVFIDEGKPSLIKEIFVGTESKEDSLKVNKVLKYLIREPFNQSYLESSINSVLNEYENSGYPFAKVELKSVAFGKEEDVTIFLKLIKSDLRKIDELKIIGNEKTDESVIVNNLNLRKGEIYSQKRIDEIPSRLNKLRFFKEVKIPKYYLNSKNKGVLEIEVQERNTNSFDGLIGYVPSRNDKGSGYLKGFVNINLRNLFGTGRGIAIKWQQDDRLSQEMFLKYMEPYIFNYPFNLNLEFFQRRQDSSFVKRIFGGDLEFLATENISGSLILESESIIPALDVKNILNSSSINTGLKLRLDYRDDNYFPKSGVLFESKYKFKKKKINSTNVPTNNISDDLNYHNYEMDFGLFLSLFERQVVAVGVHAKEIIGNYFDESDFYRFGGTNTLRGFRESQFLGNRIIWSNLEYRFLLSPTSYIFTFYDAGYFLIKENEFSDIEKQSDLNNGFGFGISLNTSLGIVNVSYAFTKGTSLTSGLIHFGIRNDF